MPTVKSVSVKIAFLQLQLTLRCKDIGTRGFWRAYGFFLFTRLVAFALSVAQFLTHLPFHLLWGPRKTFEVLTPRASDGTFLLSYNSELRRNKLSVATVTTVAFLVAIKVVSVIILALLFPSKESFAYSSSAVLNPNWDRTSYRTDSYVDFPECTPNAPTYACEAAGATTLSTGVTTIIGSCDPSNLTTTYRAAMKYSLSTIPAGATVTSVQLTVNVSTATSATITILRTSIDDISASSCALSTATGMYSRMGTGTTYTTASDWNTTGDKTYTLGSTANSDVQSRIGGTITIALTSASTTTGQIASTDALSSKPQLVVSYTAAPQAPTGVSHSAQTTPSITWSWTDNATADTANYIHDASNSVMCTTGAIASTGSTGTCQETTLSANTQYTRHVNVVDNEGNTDSSSMAAYTSIETPTGGTFSNLSTTGFDVAAAGSPSNIASGNSGVYCQESVTSSNSDWLQTNNWTKSDLTPNTQYSVQCKARNGDSVETSLSSASTKYTLIQTPTGMSLSNISTTGIDAAATGVLTNLNTGSSGVYFQESVTSTNSDWLQTNFWSKIGLSANTQYTFSAMARNGDATETSATTPVSKYTLVQTPTGITYGAIGTTSIGLSASGTLANLSAGSSGLYFQESVTGTNSGWVQANSWIKSGLFPNTQYTFQAMARNGDATETSLTDASSKYTAIQTPTHVAADTITTTSLGVSAGGMLTNIASELSGIYIQENSTSTYSDWLQTNSWTKSSLAPNTQYTFQAKARNGNATETGLTAPAPFYTAIETPSGVMFSDVSVAGITASAGGALSNIASGSAGIFCQESVTGTNSGWLKTNAWALSTLTPNTRYSFQCMARNGDAVETPLTSVVSKATAAADPNVTSVRAPSTWYTTASFPFSSTPSFGPGGVHYYRSVWNDSATYSWAATEGSPTESTWSDTNARCPNGACTTAGATLTVEAPSQGTNWYLHLRAYNSDGLAAGTQDLGPYWFDGTAPTLSTLAASVSQTTATITWTTDEASTSVLEYGTTASYGTSVSGDISEASHTLTLTGLTAGTTYHVRAHSLDAAGNEGLSADAIVTTTAPSGGAVPSPTISSPLNNAIVYDRRPTFSGRVRAGTTLVVLIDKKINGVKKVAGSGTVTLAFNYRPSLPLSYGVHQLTMLARDAKGNESAVSTPRTFVIAEPATPRSLAVSSVVKGARPLVTVNGTAPLAGKVRILIDGVMVKTIVVKKGQRFQYRYATPRSLKAGTHVAVLQIVDTKNIIRRTTLLTTFRSSNSP